MTSLNYPPIAIGEITEPYIAHFAVPRFFEAFPFLPAFFVAFPLFSAFAFDLEDVVLFVGSTSSVDASLAAAV